MNGTDLLILDPCIEIHHNVTKAEACELLGIDTSKVDYALPQLWLDDLVRTVHAPYDEALSSFVWFYGESAAFGRPRPLTDHGRMWLKLYDERKGDSYSVHTDLVLKIKD